MSVDRLAEGLTAAADRLTAVDRSVPGLAVSAGAFGADDAGRPGRVGHDLHTHWHAVLTARAGEAAYTAARLTDLADAVRTTAAEYSGTDEAAARRLQRGTTL